LSKNLKEFTPQILKRKTVSHIQDMIKNECEMSLNWTICKAGVDVCVTDKRHRKQQVRCVVCRKWYHVECLKKENKFNIVGNYFICCR
jgi:hypothetical protein